MSETQITHSVTEITHSVMEITHSAMEITHSEPFWAQKEPPKTGFESILITYLPVPRAFISPGPFSFAVTAARSATFIIGPNILAQKLRRSRALFSGIQREAGSALRLRGRGWR